MGIGTNAPRHGEADKPLNDCQQRIHGVYVTGLLQQRAIAAIIDERDFQDKKHGHPNNNPHSLGAWALTIRKELEELETAIIKGGVGRDNAISELIQIGALVVAALEQWGVEPIEGRCL